MNDIAQDTAKPFKWVGTRPVRPDGADKVKITAVAGKSKIEIEATETEPHSGIFVGNIFPIVGQPKRPNDIVVGPEDDDQFRVVLGDELAGGPERGLDVGGQFSRRLRKLQQWGVRHRAEGERHGDLRG